MSPKITKMRWVMILAGAALIGTLIFLTLQQSQHQYEVCVTFKGSSHCATATGETPAEAIRAAQAIDCQLLANGRDENMVCLDTEPASVRPVGRK